MKISKLFHWLYAIIMILPILAIGVTCLVNTFNNQAKEEVNVNYRYESNEVNSINDVKVGNIYKLDTSTLDRTQSKVYFYCTYIEIINFSNALANADAESYGSNCKLDFYFDSSYNNFAVRLYNGSSLVTNIISTGYQRFSYINFVVDEILDTSIINNLLIVPQNEIEIQSVEQKDLSNIFYYSVDKVIQSNLFNWAYNSFLVTPFSYIVALFSMPTNSPIVMLLSYWLAISIIWLVFDVVMYVPLLVHRWLDKGVVE